MSTAKPPRPGRNARKGNSTAFKLSPLQQSMLWPMLAEAWAAHVCRQNLADNSSAAKDAWRKEYLREKVGIESLKTIPSGGPLYAKVMGALQEVARNGIDWIIKAGGYTASSLLYHARAVLAEHDIPEPYACGIARQALQLATQPTLEELSPAELDRVVKILHAQAPRISTSLKKSTPQEDSPF